MIEDLGKDKVYDKYVCISKQERDLTYGTLLLVRLVQTEIDSGQSGNQEIIGLVLLPNTRNVSRSQIYGWWKIE